MLGMKTRAFRLDSKPPVGVRGYGSLHAIVRILQEPRPRRYDGTMARHMLVVLTNAAEGRDAEFNEWYTETHLADVLGVDGFIAAQRFALAPMNEGEKIPARYLALYEIETDDLAATLEALSAGAGGMVISEAMTDPLAMVATPITERVRA